MLCGGAKIEPFILQLCERRTFLVVFVYKNGRHLNGYIAYCGPGRTLQSRCYRCAMLPGTVLSAYATGGAENMYVQWSGVLLSILA